MTKNPLVCTAYKLHFILELYKNADMEIIDIQKGAWRGKALATISTLSRCYYFKKTLKEILFNLKHLDLFTYFSIKELELIYKYKNLIRSLFFDKYEKEYLSRKNQLYWFRLLGAITNFLC